MPKTKDVHPIREGRRARDQSHDGSFYVHLDNALSMTLTLFVFLLLEMHAPGTCSYLNPIFTMANVTDSIWSLFCIFVTNYTNVWHRDGQRDLGRCSD